MFKYVSLESLKTEGFSEALQKFIDAYPADLRTIIAINKEWPDKTEAEIVADIIAWAKD